MRPTFHEIWDTVCAADIRIVTTLKDLFPGASATTIDELLTQESGAAAKVKELQEAGIEIRPDTTLETPLFTTSIDIAPRFGMVQADE